MLAWDHFALDRARLLACYPVEGLLDALGFELLESHRARLEHLDLVTKGEHLAHLRRFRCIRQTRFRSLEGKLLEDGFVNSSRRVLNRHFRKVQV